MTGVEPAYSIVFVCMGNICRSPTAEAVMTHLLADAGLADRVAVASAGTGGWHVGDGIDERAGAALLTAGYDGSRHRARQFARTWFDDYDLVVAMDRSNRHFLTELARDDADRGKIRLIRSYDPSAARRGELDVPDPYYEDDEGFATVLGMIESGCRGLLEEVRAVVDGAA
jgi:protein-tyrosine phosphatase